MNYIFNLYSFCILFFCDFWVVYNKKNKLFVLVKLILSFWCYIMISWFLFSCFLFGKGWKLLVIREDFRFVCFVVS